MRYDFNKLLDTQNPAAQLDIEWDQGKEMIRITLYGRNGQGYYGSYDKKNTGRMIDLLKWYYDQMI